MAGEGMLPQRADGAEDSAADAAGEHFCRSFSGASSGRQNAGLRAVAIVEFVIVNEEVDTILSTKNHIIVE